METNIIDTTQAKPEDSGKVKVAEKLFDKSSPEMITFLKGGEIDKLSIMISLIGQENQLRQSMNIENNPMSDILFGILVLRCSFDGWRAKQGVEIIKNLEEQQKTEDVSQKLQRLLRG